MGRWSTVYRPNSAVSPFVAALTAPSSVLRYGAAVAFTLVALLLKLALGPVIVPSVFLTFYAAVLLSAWFGGFGPGAVATALSAVLGEVLFMPPAESAAGTTQMTAFRTALFVVAALAISWLTVALRRTQRRAAEVLEAARGELEERVQERTAELVAANRSLRESEGKFRTLAETVPVATCIFQGPAVCYVNPAAAALTGYTCEELLTMHFWDVIHPEHRELMRERGLARQRGEPVPAHDEMMVVTKSGDTRWVDFSAGMIDFEGGRAVLGTAFDVTERKHAELVLESRVAQRTLELSQANRLLREEIRQRQEAEDALRESEQRFRATFEQAAVGVSIVSPDGRWLLVNDRLCEILGYSRQELLQRRFLDLTHPDDIESGERPLRQIRANEIQAYSIEKRYIRKDATSIWANVTASAVRGTDGSVKYGLTIVQDISARKRVETDLRAAEDRLRRLVEQLPAITYVLALDDAQSTLYISPQVETTLGFTPGEWVADPDLWNRQLHPHDRSRVIAEVAHSHATGAPLSSDYRMYTCDGALLWFHDEAVVIRDETGTLQFSQGVLIDITARKQAEEELEASNRRMRTILEEITDGFFALDHAGHFTYLNPSATRLLRRSNEDLIGKSVWESFPAAVGSVFYEQYQRAMSDRVAAHYESYYPPLNRWFRVHGYPSQRGISILFEDVTETHEHDVTTLSDILRALNAEIDVAVAFPRVAAALRALTQCDRSNLIFFDADYEEATVIALSDARLDVGPGTHLRMCDIPAAADVVAGRTHLVPDLALELHSPIVRTTYADGFRSLVCLPLRGTQQIFGMLTLAWRKLDGVDRAQLPLLDQIADAVALATEKSRLFEEVRAGRERLEALSHRLLEVQEAERQHIARELHDEIGQTLTALKLSLDTAVGLSDDGALPRLNASRLQVNELVARVRNLALDLRPAMLDDLGLLPALLWFFGRYAEQTGVQVGFEHRGLERRLSAEIETAAYRIVQEALTNVARHAGVQQVTVRTWCDQDTLSVQIIDQGAGFEPAAALASGLTSGVSGMRERALLLGGHLRVESERGKGTRVNAELPLNEAANEVTACP